MEAQEGFGEGIRKIVFLREPLPERTPLRMKCARCGQGTADGFDYVCTAEDRLVLGGKNVVKNLQMNKVTLIARQIGAKPVLAFGNSMTDASMLNYTIHGNRYRALGFMVCCDDLEREYGNAAKADRMRDACRKNGWIPISMRDDWKTIYGEQ